MLIKYKSSYPTKEQSKDAARRLINMFSAPIAGGTLVAHDKKEEVNKQYFLSTLDLNTNGHVIDFLEANKILGFLSIDWSWEFSSLHASKSMDLDCANDGRVIFIDVVPDKQDRAMQISFYMISNSETEATKNIMEIIDTVSTLHLLTGVSKYFKIDDCYIVNVKFFLKEGDMEEYRRILLSFSKEWRFIGLEARTEQCLIDENITNMRAVFREAKI